jgi:hypothetical protein
MKTNNYSKFKFSKENREIKVKVVSSIKDSMQKFGFIPGRPVLIDSDGYIIDGQHRFLAAKELGIDVEYEVLDGESFTKMIYLNSTQSNWTLQDYVNSYASQNIDCYRKLLKFQDKYDLTLSSAITLFFTGGEHSKDIREGKDIKIRGNAEAIMEFILNCNTVPYYKDNKFIRAVVSVYDKLTKSQLNRLKGRLIVIPKLSNANDFVIAFENVINKNRKSEHKVYLSK